MYYITKEIKIREMKENDVFEMFDLFEEDGKTRDFTLLNNYFVDQEKGKILILVAIYKNQFSGFLTIIFNAESGPFTNQFIPEIGDLNVFKKFQNKGIANLLLDVAEDLIFENYNEVSLAVGMNKTYGQAQRIYVKRGYIPDGSGIWYKDMPLDSYAHCINNDDLVMYLKKGIKKT